MLLNNPVVEVRRGVDVDGLTSDVIAGRDKCRATWDKRGNMEGLISLIRQIFEVEMTEERMKMEVTMSQRERDVVSACLADAWLWHWCLPIAVHRSRPREGQAAPSPLRLAGRAVRLPGSAGQWPGQPRCQRGIDNRAYRGR